MVVRIFHIHLISDSTGETLINVSRAVTVQWDNVSAVEHVYPLVRSEQYLERAFEEIKSAPGLVLYTIVNQRLVHNLEEKCKILGLPCLSVLKPVYDLFSSYFGETTVERPGAQHTLNADYFRRIDAMNFTLAHDDGNLPAIIDDADIVLLGVSRTSKTPTSIYLANKGFKTTNFPLTSNFVVPDEIVKCKKALVVGLFASPDRIVHIRKNRFLSKGTFQEAYTDFDSVNLEISKSKKIFNRHNWPMIDVTRKSIEEIAATIIGLHRKRNSLVS